MKALLFFCLFLLIRHVHADEGPALIDPTTGDVFPMKSSHVDCTLNGPIATATLTQIYRNSGERPMNARYLFPSSTGAAVHGMTFNLNGRKTRAVIKRKDEARDDFEKAKAENKSASLLEQQRPNIFSMEVSTLLPGDEVEIEIVYSEILKPENSYYEFVIPTAIGPRYSSDSQANPAPVISENPYVTEKASVSDLFPTAKTSFSADITIQSPLPIKDLVCQTHSQAAISFQSAKEAKVNLPPCAPDRDFIIRYTLAGNKINSGVLSHREGNDGTLILHMEPPTEIIVDQIPPRNFTFVLDTSGSMSGFPLNLTKDILTELISQMRPSDTFNVLQFAGSANEMSSTPLPCTPENLSNAQSFIRNTRGFGGTELKSAMVKAISLARKSGDDRSNSIVLLTDGFITAEEDVFHLMREKATGINIIPIGVGSSVNRHLMEGLSRFNAQEPIIVTQTSEIETAKNTFLTTAGQPLLTNIQMVGKGIKLADQLPSSHPDLFAGTPLTLISHFTGDGRKSGTEQSITITGTLGNGQSFSRTFEVSNKAQDISSLPLLWAREKVRELADYSTLFNDKETVEEVTQLALKHQLLSPYTSFVAITDEVRPVNGDTQDVTQPLPVPHNVGPASIAHSSSVGSVPEPSSALLLLIATVGLLTVRKR